METEEVTTTTTTTETVVKVEEKVEEIESNENHIDADETKPQDAGEEDQVEAEAEASPKPEENGIAPAKVRLDQHPPWPKIPSPLPKCLTVETYLRMMKIPYECTYKGTPDWSKLPLVVYEGTTQKQDIIEFLISKFEVDPDASLSEEQKAVSRAFQLMVGESTAWSLVHYRWIDNYAETKKYYKGKGLLVPDVRTKLEKNKCSKCLEAHTIGKHTKEQIYSIAEKDLRALSTFLADKEFFMGCEPTTIDCTMFGLLANFVYPDDTQNSPQRKLIVDELKNIVDFCDRMKMNYWLDWADVCNDEVVEELRPKKPSLRRKKRTKSSTSNEGNKKAEAVSAENPEEKKEENGEAEAPVEDAATPEESKEDEGAKEGEEVKEEGEKNDDDEAPASPEEASEQPAEEGAAAAAAE